MEAKSKHFVLVHGMCHGAWCWYKIAALLEAAGHHVTAPELSASGINPRRIEEVESFADYCRPLLEVMAAIPKEEKVILVGHSLGGFGIALAMEKFPDKISAAVFVTAVMPSEMLSVANIEEEVWKFYFIICETVKVKLLCITFWNSLLTNMHCTQFPMAQLFVSIKVNLSSRIYRPN
jgi:pimeloyl-ACP methyl ester carboxylesterase